MTEIGTQTDVEERGGICHIKRTGRDLKSRSSSETSWSWTVPTNKHYKVCQNTGRGDVRPFPTLLGSFCKIHYMGGPSLLYGFKIRSVQGALLLSHVDAFLAFEVTRPFYLAQ